MLFHDAQYGDDEYPDHVGWGHSAIEHVIGFARKAEVGTVVLFHHDPYHTDDELDELLASTPTNAGTPTMHAVCLAYEGMTVVLDPGGVRVSSPTAS